MGSRSSCFTWYNPGVRTSTFGSQICAGCGGVVEPAGATQVVVVERYTSVSAYILTLLLTDTLTPGSGEKVTSQGMITRKLHCIRSELV